MLTFKQFCVIFENNTTFFHSTHQELTNNSVDNYPIWLSHSEHQAKGWHQNSIDNHGIAYTYSAHVNGKIANHDDKNIKKMFSDSNINQDSYHADLASNPTADEVHNHPATKLLQNNGYIGYTHPDYDSHDFDLDHDSTVIFNKKNVNLNLKFKNTNTIPFNHNTNFIHKNAASPDANIAMSTLHHPDANELTTYYAADNPNMDVVLSAIDHPAADHWTIAYAAKNKNPDIALMAIKHPKSGYHTYKAGLDHPDERVREFSKTKMAKNKF